MPRLSPQHDRRNGTPEGMTEKDFLRWVKQAAQLYGYRIYHHRPAMHGKRPITALEGDPGLPDLLMVKPPRLIFAELKVNYNKPSEEQVIWIEKLSLCPGCECYLWYPKHREEILKILAGTGEYAR